MIPSVDSLESRPKHEAILVDIPRQTGHEPGRIQITPVMPPARPRRKVSRKTYRAAPRRGTPLTPAPETANDRRLILHYAHVYTSRSYPHALHPFKWGLPTAGLPFNPAPCTLEHLSVTWRSALIRRVPVGGACHRLSCDGYSGSLLLGSDWLVIGGYLHLRRGVL